MPGRNVNIWTSNWHATGATPQVSQYSLTIRVTWIDDAGNTHDRTEDVLFPNCLAGEFTLAERKEIAEEIMFRAVRKRLGVD